MPLAHTKIGGIKFAQEGCAKIKGAWISSAHLKGRGVRSWKKVFFHKKYLGYVSKIPFYWHEKTKIQKSVFDMFCVFLQRVTDPNFKKKYEFVADILKLETWFWPKTVYRTFILENEKIFFRI